MNNESSTTNWSAVVNCLDDALDYLMNDSRESIMFKVQLELLLDRAMWNCKDLK